MVNENNLSTEAVFSVVRYETAKGRKTRKTRCYIHSHNKATRFSMLDSISTVTKTKKTET